MLQALDSYQGLTCFAVTELSDIDMPALLALHHEAWRADYLDQAHIDFDATFLRRLMTEPHWVAMMVCTDDGQPVGFELAMERLLYCRQRPMQVYYNANLAVSPPYRRRGLGRWMVHCSHHLLFHKRHAEAIVAAFHPAHAGLPTIKQAYTSLPNWRLRRFHTAAVWSRRLDRKPVPPMTPSAVVTRITLPHDALHFTPLSPHGGQTSLTLPAVATYTHALYAHYQVAFAPAASFRTRYLQGDAPEAGTFWYDFGNGRTCSISFEILGLTSNDRHLGRLGQIQTIVTLRCTPGHVSQALHHICGFFQDQGCLIVALLDHGVVPHQLLQTLAFVPTGDAEVFVVRGPQETVQAFDGVCPPYVIDL